MKVTAMEALRALVLSEAQLYEMLMNAARQGAALAVDELRSQLHQAPEDATLSKLRAYLANPASHPNPHDAWAHSGIIRQIEMTSRGKPKSPAWFMKFQRETGLNACSSRASPTFGRRKEWSFHDVRLAWNAYYSKR